MTARELVTDILQDLNVVGGDEVPSDHDAHLVLRKMNRWISSLLLENLALFYLARTEHPLTANVASYTVGTGGAINITRPDHFDQVGLILDTAATPPSELPVEILTDQRWQDVLHKSLTSTLVQAVYYDRNWNAGLATLYLWPVPTVGNTALVLYRLAPLTEFADLNTVYTLPPGYELFFETNVLELVAPTFGKQVTTDQAKAAAAARVRVKRANIRPVEIGVDAALLARGSSYAFDIRTGGFR